MFIGETPTDKICNFVKSGERSKSIFKYKTSVAIIVAAVITQKRGGYKSQMRRK